MQYVYLFYFPRPLAVDCKMYGLRPPSQWLKGTVIEVINKDQSLFKVRITVSSKDFLRLLRIVFYGQFSEFILVPGRYVC